MTQLKNQSHFVGISLIHLIDSFKTTFNGKRTRRKGDSCGMTIVLYNSAESLLIQLTVGYCQLFFIKLTIFLILSFQKLIA